MSCRARLARDASGTRRDKPEAGQTFEFLTAQRLHEAQRLLRDTDWSVDMVANMVGLKPAQFRLLFRCHLQTTPTRFRR